MAEELSTLEKMRQAVEESLENIEKSGERFFLDLTVHELLEVAKQPENPINSWVLGKLDKVCLGLGTFLAASQNPAASGLVVWPTHARIEASHSIREVGFSGRTCNALMRAGVETVGQLLMVARKEGGLKTLSGIGPRCIAEATALLEKYDLLDP